MNAMILQAAGVDVTSTKPMPPEWDRACTLGLRPMGLFLYTFSMDILRRLRSPATPVNWRDVTTDAAHKYRYNGRRRWVQDAHKEEHLANKTSSNTDTAKLRSRLTQTHSLQETAE